MDIHVAAVHKGRMFQSQRSLSVTRLSVRSKHSTIVHCCYVNSQFQSCFNYVMYVHLLLHMLLLYILCRFLALLSIVLAPIASYLLYLAVHSTTDYG